MHDMITDFEKCLNNATQAIASMTDNVRAGYDTLTIGQAFQLAKMNERRLNQIDKDLSTLRTQAASLKNAVDNVVAKLEQQVQRIDQAACRVVKVEERLKISQQ